MAMYFLNCKLIDHTCIFYSFDTLIILSPSELLNYGQSSGAYYIKCHDCREDFAGNPTSQFWVDWQTSICEAEEKLKEKYSNPV